MPVLFLSWATTVVRALAETGIDGMMHLRELGTGLEEWRGEKRKSDTLQLRETLDPK